MIIKVILVILAVLGIYNRRTTFAEIQPVCINNVSLIPLSPCKINFTNIKDAITYLENRINIANASIYDSTDYQTLHEVLHNYCPENKTINTDDMIQTTEKEITDVLPKESNKKLSALATLFDTYKSRTLQRQENTGINKEYCQQKYIDYVVIDMIKQNFMTILDKANISSTQNSVFESIDKKDDTIL